MKKIFLCLISMAMLFISTPAFASKLPNDMWGYIKKELPNATQRFDSVVVINEDTMYVPLYPAQKETPSNIAQEYSYPEGKTLKQLPEVIIFNNNFVLLKIFKNKSGEYTLTSHEDLPIKVKLGLMPQDMLVPVGLRVPDSLNVVLGDLIIPSKSDGTLAIGKDGSESKLLTLENIPSTSFAPIKELSNKRVYVTSNASKFMLVYDNNSKNPLYELKLNALPSKILASNNTKFALLTYYANKNIEVADLKNERVLSQIPIEANAKDADIDRVKNIGYVSAPEANSIYVVDLNSGKLTKTLKLAQAPGVLALSDDGNYLAFIDNNTQGICFMELSGEYMVKELTAATSASKLVFLGDKIYAVSRTKSKIDTYDISNGALLESRKLSQKPVDVLYQNDKIYILCAGASSVDIYDTKNAKVVDTIKLSGGGFYSKITRVPNSQNALITGINTGKYYLLDLDENKIVKSQPFEIKVSNIMVVDR